ncbi:MAG: ABC transporter permease subunit [Nitriliruptoraceae bacterium]
MTTLTRLRALPGWAATIAITAVVAAPILVLGASVLDPSVEVWVRLWETRLPRMIRETVLLLGLVLGGALLLGTGLAWLVAAHRFPGRRVLGWLLVTPLAVPGYVAGFVWLDTLSGPLGIRAVRSLWVGAFALVLTLYPYVYLFARAAFRDVGTNALDAARTLGHGPVSTFLRVALPMARPALAAGGALVAMEVLTDIGTVRLFNIGTLADGVLRVWFGTGDRQAAAELATALLVAAVVLIASERLLRRGASFTTGGTTRPLVPQPMAPRQAGIALAVVLTVLVVAVGVPLLRLLDWVGEVGTEVATVAGGLGHHVRSTVVVAGAASVTSLVAGSVLALSVRRRGSAGRLLGRVSSLGYAMPGPVVAVGVVITLAALDRVLPLPPGSVLVGSTLGLVFALVVRYLAVGYQGVDAGLDRVPPETVDSARVLGSGPTRTALTVELPQARYAVLAAAALLAIDTIKELPITLLLRPFGVDTLAVWVWQATSESLWAQAALPSLAMVAVGMAAVGGLLVALERGAEVRS